MSFAVFQDPDFSGALIFPSLYSSGGVGGRQLLTVRTHGAGYFRNPKPCLTVCVCADLHLASLKDDSVTRM